MPDFYFLGEEELVTAFKLVGVDGQAVVGREEALDAFRRLTGQSAKSGSDGRAASAGTAVSGASAADAGLRAGGVTQAKVLILSSGTASLLEDETRDWQYGGAYPLIVEIPSPGAGTETGRSLVAAIREAVGISI